MGTNAIVCELEQCGLNLKYGQPTDEVTNAIGIVVKLAGVDSNYLLMYYVASSADGLTIAATQPSVGTIFANATEVFNWENAASDGPVHLIATNTDGDLSFSIAHVGAATFYPVFVLPFGKIVVLPAFVFA